MNHDAVKPGQTGFEPAKPEPLPAPSTRVINTDSDPTILSAANDSRFQT